VIVPAEVDHVMALFETEPVTLAVNCCVAPVVMVAVDGEIVIELTLGVVTVTVAVAVLVGSAKLVTVMVAVPADAPAVKTPAELIVPELADQAMDLFATVPCTVALNCCVAPARMLAVGGVTVIEVTVGALTVIVADADLVGSATLVAVTFATPDVDAVKRPLAVIEPPVADQVTDLFAIVPCTVAVNCCVAPVRREGAAGLTETELTTGAATVMVAVADLVVSATLVAVIVAVPAVVEAVKRPLALIVPDEVFQVTDLFVALPCTVAVSCSVAPVAIELVGGVTEIEDTATGAAVTVTAADEDFVGSATLVAVMVTEPVFAGAV
jgi:hypothetical protein